MPKTATATCSATGNFYLVAFDAAGQWFNGSAFEEFDVDNWASYAIAVTGKGGGEYHASVPDATTAFQLRKQVGESPASTDPYFWRDTFGETTSITGQDKADIAALVIAGLSGRDVKINSPVMNDDDGEPSLELYAGDAYPADRPIAWTIENYSGPDLDGAAIALRLIDAGKFISRGASAAADLELTASAAQAGTTLTLSFTATANQTGTLTTVYPTTPAPTHRAQVIATAINQTLIDLPATVKRRIA